jgi:hypothetical protein
MMVVVGVAAAADAALGAESNQSVAAPDICRQQNGRRQTKARHSTSAPVARNNTEGPRQKVELQSAATANTLLALGRSAIPSMERAHYNSIMAIF